MQFQAILSNPVDPEYGVATIPFPLPMEEYDHSMEVLEALEIGDAIIQDCKVEKITNGYLVLQRLEGQSVNVDELDYLAKRLDSFCADEDAQFQAMAEKLDLTDIKDFINLTFCCQEATVITDFSDLKKIGRDHYMNLNGGCALMEELENLDGKETARLLIDSGAGVVTPYGVVYDNGMKLEPLYRGGAFPPYLYDAYPLALKVTPVAEPEGTKNIAFLGLPMTEKRALRCRTKVFRWVVWNETTGRNPLQKSESLVPRIFRAGHNPPTHRLRRGRSKTQRQWTHSPDRDEAPPGIGEIHAPQDNRPILGRWPLL